MRRRDFSFTLALITSIVVHGWFVSEAIKSISSGYGSFFPSFRAQPILVAAKEKDEELGEQNGMGDAIDSSPGEELLQARQAEQTQILGSLDPEGAGQFRDRPSMSVLPQGGSVSPPQPQQQPETPVGVAPTGILDSPDAFGKLRRKSTEAPQSQNAQSADSAPAQATNQSSVAGVASPSADPAPQASTESDPVSVAGGAFFRNGKAIVQFGRKHKLTAPRLNLSAKTDLINLPSPTIIVLKIKTDAAGNVSNVSIFRSSGSADIDQICRVEAYNWWLEPKRDKSDRPVEDEFLFTIQFS